MDNRQQPRSLKRTRRSDTMQLRELLNLRLMSVPLIAPRQSGMGDHPEQYSSAWQAVDRSS